MDEFVDDGAALPADDGNADISAPESGEAPADGVENAQEGHAEQPPINWEKRYNDLRPEFDRTKNLVKEFEAFGGPQGAVNLLRQITTDPDMLEFIAQKARGQNQPPQEPEYDEDTRRALDLVDQRAEAKARALLEQYQQQVNPYIQQIQAERIDGLMKSMDSKYEGWQEYRQAMAELAQTLPQGRQENPTLDDMEDLYIRAVRKSGKLDEVMAKTYQRKLEERKRQSTGRPSDVSEGGVPRPKTIAEALDNAMRQHNATKIFG